MIDIKVGYKKSSLGVMPDDWKIQKMKEIGEFYRGKGIPKKDLEEEGLNAIRYGEIYTVHHYFIKEFYSFIDKETANSSFPLSKGDVLFTGSGETLEDIGKSVAFISDYEAYAGGDITILRPKKNIYDSKFLGFLTNNDVFRRQTYRAGQGQSVVHIYPSNLKEIKLPIPPLPEQKAIADCLSTWDKGIENLSALIASKKEQKKGLMQGVFNGKLKIENGKLIKVEDEKLWLKGWKEIKLKKTAKFLRGKGLSKGAVIQNGKNKCILYGELYTKYNEIISKIYSRTDSTDGLPSKKYDILIPSSTTTSGIDLITASCVLENNVLLGGDLIVMRPDLNKINAKFFVYLFSNSLHKLILRYTQGVTIIHLYGKDLKEVKLNLPSIEEQAAIAEVLITADKEIELLEKKLETFKTQKKGLMQVLLTGERRLI